MFDGLKRFFSAMFPASSAEAENINQLFLNYLILAAVVMLTVTLMVLLGGYLYRKKVRPDIPPQIFGNRRAELIWTILPLIAVTFFFLLAVRSMKQINYMSTTIDDFRNYFKSSKTKKSCRLAKALEACLHKEIGEMKFGVFRM